MSRFSRPTLKLPPFPELTWSDGCWEGRVVLDGWTGFAADGEEDGSEESGERSDGTVGVFVWPLNEEVRRPPEPEQVATFRHLLENQVAIRDAVLGAIFAEYPSLVEVYGASEEMPPIDRPEQLKALIRPTIVHVWPVAEEGLTRVGFEFHCTWDAEHGLGVLTHRARVVEVGGADASFDDCFAGGDATSEEADED